MSESARATEERGRRAIGVSASDSLAELHRAAILEAMVELVAERGYAETSLGVLLERAQVSRRTFYELFPSMEECFTAILDEGMTLMAGVTVHAFTKERHWLDGLLKAEAAVLSCLDSEPQMARALLVEALGVGSWALEHRERNIRQLRELVLEQLSNVSPTADFPPSAFPPMAAAGVMASIMGMIQDHLLRREPAPLISLLGPLMGVITGPYLDPEGVAREVRRGEELSREILEGPYPPPPAQPRVSGRAAQIPDVLRDPRAHRARGCLLHVVSTPGSSNRQIASAVGVTGHTQISTLLTRLERIGLLIKRAGPRGSANAWFPTPDGERVAGLLRSDERSHRS
jgi:AcrR family transcriptional regulator